MAIEGLKPAELIKLVEVCALSGVKELKIGTIYINFGEMTETNRTFVGTHLSKKPGKASMEVQTDHDALVLDDLAEEENQLSQMLIDDPMGFENEVMDEMTKGVPNESNESRRVEPALQRQ